MPAGRFRKGYGFCLVVSGSLSFFCPRLSFSLSWLDLKAQATSMLRRLDDAPPHTLPPLCPPSWVCQGINFGTENSRRMAASLVSSLLSPSSSSLSCLLSSSLVRVGLRDTAQGNRISHTHCTHNGAPFLSCCGDSSYRLFLLFISFRFALVYSPLSAAILVLSQRF